MNRPLVWTGVAFVAGMSVAALGVLPGWPLPLLVLTLGAVAAYWPRRVAELRHVSVALLFFAAGGILWNARHAGPPGDAISDYIMAHPDTQATVEGYVRLGNLDLPANDSVGFLLDVATVQVGQETLPLRGGVSVRWSRPGPPVYAGERVRATGRMDLSLGHVNPGLQDVEDHMRRNGINSSLRASGPNGVQRIAPASLWSIRYWASRLRAAQAGQLQKAVPPSALPFVLAVWLGNRSDISQDEYQAYVNSGTIHILSVGGVHMGMVFFSVTFLLRMFVRSRRYRTLLVMIAVLSFTLMSGLRASSLRSAVMILVYLAAELFDREPDTPTALSLSAIILLAWDPDTLLDAGFQLSFLCVASILLFSDHFTSLLERFPRWIPHRVRSSVAVTLGVQFLPFPLAIHYFHVIPLGSVFANLLVVPLTTVALWISFLTTACSLLSSQLAPVFGHALLPVVWLIRKTVSLAGTPSAGLYLTSPTTVAMLAYWILIALCAAAILKPQRRRRYGIGAVCSAMVLVLLWSPLRRPEPEVVFLDVGHGDAAFIRAPGGGTMLIDGGQRSQYVDAGSRFVAPFLWSRHVRRLDYMAVSHPDNDHLGGLFYVVEHFRVGQVLMSSIETDRPLEQEFLALCSRRGIPVRRLFRGETFTLGDVTVEALYPNSDTPRGDNVNDEGLVLRLNWPGAGILFPGDGQAATERILTGLDCRADVLKAPHHGSKTSSSEMFLTAVRARDCVVSTGGSIGREPTDLGVLNRYRNHGMRVWRTDRLGGIRLTDHNGSLCFEGARPQRGYPCIGP